MIQFKKHKRLALLSIIFCLVSIYATAQDSTITKYFDSSWKKTSKDSAFFFTEIVKVGRYYRYTSYWMSSKKLKSKSAYSDTLFARPIGLLLRFYENGQTEDSTYHNEEGKMINTYHYYNNGKLWVHYVYNPKTKKDITDAYDLNGNRIADFIYLRQAVFQEGTQDWINYLSENVKTNVPVKKGAPIGNYQVIIKFIVGKNGKISDVQAETNYGYGMEDEVIRVIKKSPNWNPAILMGEAVNAYRRQPITFIVAMQ